MRESGEGDARAMVRTDAAAPSQEACWGDGVRLLTLRALAAAAGRLQVPSGLLPVLEVDGQIITESAVIQQVLEQLAPQPAMLPPEDSAERRRAAQLMRLERRLFSDWMQWLCNSWYVPARRIAPLPGYIPRCHIVKQPAPLPTCVAGATTATAPPLWPPWPWSMRSGGPRPAPTSSPSLAWWTSPLRPSWSASPHPSATTRALLCGAR